MFQQLHAYHQEPTNTPLFSGELQTPDRLNIINVALARQRDAVQAGCAGDVCPDNTNLVNTLYQRHQTLLQHQQQPEQQRKHQSEQQNKQSATVDAPQVGLAQPAVVTGQAANALTDAMLSDSPTFQGETVPDTPVAAAEAAAQEAAVEPAAEAAQDASQGLKKLSGIEGADVNGVDSLLDLEIGLDSRQSSSALAAAVVDTSLRPESARAVDQHEVMQSRLPNSMS